jgi:small subunit ribosomal protein S13
MPRMMGVDIPDRKRVEYSLAYLFGVGLTRARIVVAQCKIDPAKKAGDLTPDEIRHITAYIQEHFRVEGDLRREVSQNIRRLISIGSYRGSRHKRGLPVRGQRTRTNARTRKGGKKTVGAVRDKAVRQAIKTETKKA